MPQTDVTTQARILAPTARDVLVIDPDGKSVRRVEGLSLLAAGERAALVRAEGEAPLGAENRLVSFVLFSASMNGLGTGLSNALSMISAHGSRTDNPHAVTKSQVGLGNCDDTPDAAKPVSTAQRAAIDAAAEQAVADAGAAAASMVASEASQRISADDELWGALDVKADLVDGKVPSSQLPSFVDDVIEAANFAALPAEGEAGKIYVTIDDGRTWRWGGTAYAEISASLALGETAATAYRGDRGKIAYDHSQDTATNPHAVTKAQVGLGNCDDTSDLAKPLSNAATTALAGKADLSGGRVPLAQSQTASALGAAYVLGSWSTTTKPTTLTSIGLTLPAGHAVVGAYFSFSAAPTGTVSLFVSDGSYNPVTNALSLTTAAQSNVWLHTGVRNASLASGRAAVTADTALHVYATTGNYSDLPSGIKVVVLAVNIGATSW